MDTRKTAHGYADNTLNPSGQGRACAQDEVFDALGDTPVSSVYTALMATGMDQEEALSAALANFSGWMRVEACVRDVEFSIDDKIYLVLAHSDMRKAMQAFRSVLDLAGQDIPGITPALIAAMEQGRDAWVAALDASLQRGNIPPLSFLTHGVMSDESSRTFVGYSQEDAFGEWRAHSRLVASDPWCAALLLPGKNLIGTIRDFQVYLNAKGGEMPPMPEGFMAAGGLVLKNAILTGFPAEWKVGVDLMMSGCQGAHDLTNLHSTGKKRPLKYIDITDGVGPLRFSDSLDLSSETVPRGGKVSVANHQGTIQWPTVLSVHALELQGIPGVTCLPTSWKVEDELILRDMPDMETLPAWVAHVRSKVTIVGCPKLKTLPAGLAADEIVVSGCHALEDIPGDTCGQEITITDCARLANVDMQGRSQDSGFMPATIEVAHCPNLGSVRITGSSVVKIQECPSLKSVALPFPSPGSLTVLACPRLNTLGSVNLQELAIAGCPQWDGRVAHGSKVDTCFVDGVERKVSRRKAATP